MGDAGAVEHGARGMALTTVLLLAALPSVSAALPDDVAKFVEGAELCGHFRQEPWPEGASAEARQRREFLVSQTARFCGGLAEEAQRLRRKYREAPAIIERLERREELFE
jgi:hypothetical protein